MKNYIMLARQNGKNKSYEEKLARLTADCMMNESEVALYFVKSNLEPICRLFGLDIDGDILKIGDRKYFVHLLRGTVIEIEDAPIIE